MTDTQILGWLLERSGLSIEDMSRHADNIGAYEEFRRITNTQLDWQGFAVGDQVMLGDVQHTITDLVEGPVSTPMAGLSDHGGHFGLSILTRIESGTVAIHELEALADCVAMAGSDLADFPSLCAALDRAKVGQAEHDHETALANQARAEQP